MKPPAAALTDIRQTPANHVIICGEKYKQTPAKKYTDV